MKFIPTALHELYKHRTLLRTLISREIRQRYRGTALGLLWSLISPVLQLAIYAFVFRSVFSVRWPISNPNHSNDLILQIDMILPEEFVYALNLFIGLMIFSLFSEVISRSPRHILDHPQFVRKVIFPLPIFAFVASFAAMFHALMYWVVLVTAIILSVALTTIFVETNGLVASNLNIMWDFLTHGAWLSLVVLSLAFPYLLGFSWLLSAIGTYFKDLSMVMPSIISFMMFLGPVFYPSSLIPEPYRIIVMLNPITVLIDQSRGVLLSGADLGLGLLFKYVVVGIVFASAAKWVFSRVQKGFPDFV